MSTRAAFARRGPGARPFPEVTATSQPSESPAPSVAAPVPLAASYHGRRLFLIDPSMRRTLRTLEICCRLPKPGCYRGETGASQVPGSSSSCMPRSFTPRRRCRRLARSRWRHCCLQALRRLGPHRTGFISGPNSQGSHACCLRFNVDVAGNAARLATGLPGSALARWDLSPLDDKRNFGKYHLLPSQSTRIAWPHRCENPNAALGGETIVLTWGSHRHLDPGPQVSSYCLLPLCLPLHSPRWQGIALSAKSSWRNKPSATILTGRSAPPSGNQPSGRFTSSKRRNPDQQVDYGRFLDSASSMFPTYFSLFSARSLSNSSGLMCLRALTSSDLSDNRTAIGL